MDSEEEEEEVEEEKASSMEKIILHTSWDTRRARGVPENTFLCVCGWIRKQCFAVPPAREVSQEVWGVIFSTQAALPRSSNFQCNLVGGVLGGSCGGLSGSF